MGDVDLKLPSSITRRSFLTKGAAVGGALAVGPLLAACGGGGSSSATGGATTGSSGGSSASSATALGEELRAAIGTPKNLLAKGPGNFKVIGSWPLSGPGQADGVRQSAGFEFGAKHIEAWTNGKLKFDVQAVDNGGGDPQKSVANARKAGLAHEPIFPTSYTFGVGSQAPLASQYEMLMLDAGGGTGPLAQGIPFCYGFRTSYPEDLAPGLVKTLLELNPDKKTVGLITGEISAEYNEALNKALEASIPAVGAEIAFIETAALGQTDYSAVISKAKEANPDMLVLLTFGADVGYQAREVQRQGLQTVNGATELNADNAKIAGSAFQDWVFGLEGLNTAEPPSDFAEIFVSNWEAENGSRPEPESGNYYALAFAYATLMDRIIGAGGDIQKGSEWVKALEEDPSFPTVYGGSGKTPGQIVISKQTHSAVSIPLLAFKIAGDGSTEPTELLASYDIGAKDFKLLNS